MSLIPAPEALNFGIHGFDVHLATLRKGGTGASPSMDETLGTLLLGKSFYVLLRGVMEGRSVRADKMSLSRGVNQQYPLTLMLDCDSPALEQG